jgi:hypothetical protein
MRTKLVPRSLGRSRHRRRRAHAHIGGRSGPSPGSTTQSASSAGTCPSCAHGLTGATRRTSSKKFKRNVSGLASRRFLRARGRKGKASAVTGPVEHPLWSPWLIAPRGPQPRLAGAERVPLVPPLADLHSSRRTRIGSRRAARTAGHTDETTAVTIVSRSTPANVGTSSGETP